MGAATYEEAIDDLREKGLLSRGGRVVVGGELLAAVTRKVSDFPSVRVESYGSACPWNFYIYSTSPCGLDFELFYYPRGEEDYEIPGLHAVEVQVPLDDVERAFFSRMGLAGTRTLSGQELRVVRGECSRLRTLAFVLPGEMADRALSELKRAGMGLPGRGSRVWSCHGNNSVIIELMAL